MRSRRIVGSRAGDPTVVAPAAITPLRLPRPRFVAHDPVDRPSGIAVSADGSTVAFSSGGA